MSNIQQNLENNNNLIANITQNVSNITNTVNNLPKWSNTYANATPQDILENKTAVVDGKLLVGTRPNLDSILNVQEDTISNINNITNNLKTTLNNALPTVYNFPYRNKIYWVNKCKHKFDKLPYCARY